MDLRFNTSLAEKYKSATQIARVLTEDWLARNMYCPICGEVSINRAEPNAPVKDYVCKHCKSQYELKSKKEFSDKYLTKVNDGVYNTMIERITSLDNPSFFFMHYDNYEVNNLIIVPKCFFVPEVIEKRKPLDSSARRAGWEGCNILLNQIPDFAKIPIIKNRVVIDSEIVCREYNKIYSLQTNSIESRGWLFDVLNCVERLDTTFTLKHMYSFVEELRLKHPNNNNIEAKIRQQLQFLRDKGFIDFSSRGIYKKVGL
jgi:type II restriction enzyme